MASRWNGSIGSYPFAIAATVGGAIVLGIAASSAWTGLGRAFLANVEVVQHAGNWGSLLFLIVAVAVVVIGVLPASLLGIAAGMIFGLLPGFALAGGGLFVGAALAFALSRSTLRPAIEGMLQKRGYLEDLDAAVAGRGWSIVVLLRLSPVVPFSAASYLLGLSSIGFRTYLVGTLAALPGLFGYVVAGTVTGAGLSSATFGDSPIRWITFGVGAVATLVALPLLVRLLLRPALRAASVDNGSA